MYALSPLGSLAELKNGSCMSECIHRGQPLRAVLVCRDTPGGKSQQAYPAFRCAIFGRCLTGLIAWQPQHEGTEARLYALCRGCVQRG